MSNLETCVVVNGKLYCWDEEEQSPKEVGLVYINTTRKIPEEALNALLKKMNKIRNITPEN